MCVAQALGRLGSLDGLVSERPQCQGLRWGHRIPLSTDSDGGTPGLVGASPSVVAATVWRGRRGRCHQPGGRSARALAAGLNSDARTKPVEANPELSGKPLSDHPSFHVNVRPSPRS